MQHNRSAAPPPHSGGLFATEKVQATSTLTYRLFGADSKATAVSSTSEDHDHHHADDADTDASLSPPAVLLRYQRKPPLAGPNKVSLFRRQIDAIEKGYESYCIHHKLNCTPDASIEKNLEEPQPRNIPQGLDDAIRELVGQVEEALSNKNNTNTNNTTTTTTSSSSPFLAITEDDKDRFAETAQSLLSSSTPSVTVTLPLYRVDGYTRNPPDGKNGRTPEVLEKSVQYLFEYLIRAPRQQLTHCYTSKNGFCAGLHEYLWDRLRQMRKDWTKQMTIDNKYLHLAAASATPAFITRHHKETNASRVKCLEAMVRYTVYTAALNARTKDQCEEFLPKKKLFMDALDDCFSFLVIYYRHEKRFRNAEMLSIILFHSIMQIKKKVENASSFISLVPVADGTVEGTKAFEHVLDEFNLQFQEVASYTELSHAPEIVSIVRLISAVREREFFKFFDLCRTPSACPLTPLQRAFIVNTFSYVRFRAIVDLVLRDQHPRSDHRANRRVLGLMPLEELSSLLLFDSVDHCRAFISKGMGLEALIAQRPAKDVPSYAAAYAARKANNSNTNQAGVDGDDDTAEGGGYRGEAFMPEDADEIIEVLVLDQKEIEVDAKVTAQSIYTYIGSAETIYDPVTGRKKSERSRKNDLLWPPHRAFINLPALSPSRVLLQHALIPLIGTGVLSAEVESLLLLKGDAMCEDSRATRQAVLDALVSSPYFQREYLANYDFEDVTSEAYPIDMSLLIDPFLPTFTRAIAKGIVVQSDDRHPLLLSSSFANNSQQQQIALYPSFNTIAPQLQEARVRYALWRALCESSVAGVSGMLGLKEDADDDANGEGEEDVANNQDDGDDEEDDDDGNNGSRGPLDTMLLDAADDESTAVDILFAAVPRAHVPVAGLPHLYFNNSSNTGVSGGVSGGNTTDDDDDGNGYESDASIATTNHIPTRVEMAVIAATAVDGQEEEECDDERGNEGGKDDIDDDNATAIDEVSVIKAASGLWACGMSSYSKDNDRSGGAGPLSTEKGDNAFHEGGGSSSNKADALAASLDDTAADATSSIATSSSLLLQKVEKLAASASNAISHVEIPDPTTLDITSASLLPPVASVADASSSLPPAPIPLVLMSRAERDALLVKVDAVVVPPPIVTSPTTSSSLLTATQCATGDSGSVATTTTAAAVVGGDSNNSSGFTFKIGGFAAANKNAASPAEGGIVVNAAPPAAAVAVGFSTPQPSDNANNSSAAAASSSTFVAIAAAAATVASSSASLLPPAAVTTITGKPANFFSFHKDDVAPPLQKKNGNNNATAAAEEEEDLMDEESARAAFEANLFGGKKGNSLFGGGGRNGSATTQHQGAVGFGGVGVGGSGFGNGGGGRISASATSGIRRFFSSATTSSSTAAAESTTRQFTGFSFAGPDTTTSTTNNNVNNNSTSAMSPLKSFGLPPANVDVAALPPNSFGIAADPKHNGTDASGMPLPPPSNISNTTTAATKTMNSLFFSSSSSDDGSNTVMAGADGGGGGEGEGGAITKRSFPSNPIIANPSPLSLSVSAMGGLSASASKANATARPFSFGLTDTAPTTTAPPLSFGFGLGGANVKKSDASKTDGVSEEAAVNKKQPIVEEVLSSSSSSEGLEEEGEGEESAAGSIEDEEVNSYDDEDFAEIEDEDSDEDNLLAPTALDSLPSSAPKTFFAAPATKATKTAAAGQSKRAADTEVFNLDTTSSEDEDGADKDDGDEVMEEYEEEEEELEQQNEEEADADDSDANTDNDAVEIISLSSSDSIPQGTRVVPSSAAIVEEAVSAAPTPKTLTPSTLSLFAKVGDVNGVNNTAALVLHPSSSLMQQQASSSNAMNTNSNADAFASGMGFSTTNNNTNTNNKLSCSSSAPSFGFGTYATAHHVDNTSSSSSKAAPSTSGGVKGFGVFGFGAKTTPPVAADQTPASDTNSTAAASTTATAMMNAKPFGFGGQLSTAATAVTSTLDTAANGSVSDANASAFLVAPKTPTVTFATATGAAAADGATANVTAATANTVSDTSKAAMKDSTNDAATTVVMHHNNKCLRVEAEAKASQHRSAHTKYLESLDAKYGKDNFIAKSLASMPIVTPTSTPTTAADGSGDGHHQTVPTHWSDIAYRYLLAAVAEEKEKKEKQKILQVAGKNTKSDYLQCVLGGGEGGDALSSATNNASSSSSSFVSPPAEILFLVNRSLVELAVEEKKISQDEGNKKTLKNKTSTRGGLFDDLISDAAFATKANTNTNKSSSPSLVIVAAANATQQLQTDKEKGILLRDSERKFVSSQEQQEQSKHQIPSTTAATTVVMTGPLDDVPRRANRRGATATIAGRRGREDDANEDPRGAGGGGEGREKTPFRPTAASNNNGISGANTSSSSTASASSSSQHTKNRTSNADYSLIGEDMSMLDGLKDFLGDSVVKNNSSSSNNDSTRTTMTARGSFGRNISFVADGDDGDEGAEGGRVSSVAHSAVKAAKPSTSTLTSLTTSAALKSREGEEDAAAAGGKGATKQQQQNANKDKDEEENTMGEDATNDDDDKGVGAFAASIPFVEYCALCPKPINTTNPNATVAANNNNKAVAGSSKSGGGGGNYFASVPTVNDKTFDCDDCVPPHAVSITPVAPLLCVPPYDCPPSSSSFCYPTRLEMCLNVFVIGTPLRRDDHHSHVSQKGENNNAAAKNGANTTTAFSAHMKQLRRAALLQKGLKQPRGDDDAADNDDGITASLTEKVTAVFASINSSNGAAALLPHLSIFAQPSIAPLMSTSLQLNSSHLVFGGGGDVTSSLSSSSSWWLCSADHHHHHDRRQHNNHSSNCAFLPSYPHFSGGNRNGQLTVRDCTAAIGGYPDSNSTIAVAHHNNDRLIELKCKSFLVDATAAIVTQNGDAASFKTEQLGILFAPAEGIAPITTVVGTVDGVPAVTGGKGGPFEPIIASLVIEGIPPSTLATATAHHHTSPSSLLLSSFLRQHEVLLGLKGLFTNMIRRMVAMTTTTVMRKRAMPSSSSMPTSDCCVDDEIDCIASNQKSRVPFVKAVVMFVSVPSSSSTAAVSLIEDVVRSLYDGLWRTVCAEEEKAITEANRNGNLSANTAALNIVFPSPPPLVLVPVSARTHTPLPHVPKGPSSTISSSSASSDFAEAALEAFKEALIATTASA